MRTKCGLNIELVFIFGIWLQSIFIQSKNNPAGIYVRLKEGQLIDAKAKSKYLINPENWSAIKGQPKNLKDAESKKSDLVQQGFVIDRPNAF